MAVMQYKRACARDKDMQLPLEADLFTTAPGAEGEPNALGLELVQLAELVLEYASEREQRIWALQLDLRDLSTSLSDCHAKAEDRQLQSLLVCTDRASSLRKLPHTFCDSCQLSLLCVSRHNGQAPA
jgi:hypothetical protein